MQRHNSQLQCQYTISRQVFAVVTVTVKCERHYARSEATLNITAL
jgi:hypothetical protein